jgi:hypothetical protein
MLMKIEFDLKDKDNWDLFNDILVAASARGFHCNGTEVMHKKPLAAPPDEQMGQKEE